MEDCADRLDPNTPGLASAGQARQRLRRPPLRSGPAGDSARLAAAPHLMADRSCRHPDGRPGAPGASWAEAPPATAASSSPSGRVGFLPLPGGINQTRATPRGVFNGQGPWNNDVTQKGTFLGGRSGHVVSHWLVTGYRETTLKMGLNEGFWCYTDGSSQKTAFKATDESLRASLPSALPGAEDSGDAPRSCSRPC